MFKAEYSLGSWERLWIGIGLPWMKLSSPKKLKLSVKWTKSQIQILTLAFTNKVELSVNLRLKMYWNIKMSTKLSCNTSRCIRFNISGCSISWWHPKDSHCHRLIFQHPLLLHNEETHLEKDSFAPLAKFSHALPRFCDILVFVSLLKDAKQQCRKARTYCSGGH